MRFLLPVVFIFSILFFTACREKTEYHDELTQEFGGIVARQTMIYMIVDSLMAIKAISLQEAKIATRYLERGDKFIDFLKKNINSDRSQEFVNLAYSTFVTIITCQEAALDIVSLLIVYKNTEAEKKKNGLPFVPVDFFSKPILK